VLRILPPFYLVLGVGMALTAAGWLGSTLTREAVTWQICHVTNYYIITHDWWTGMPPGTSVYWSLAVEEHFYLFFPLLFVLLRRRLPHARQIALVLLGICVVVLLWRLVLVFGLDVAKERTYIATDTRIDSILLGCILALWNNPVLDPKGISDRHLAWRWLPAGVGMVVLSLVVRQHWFDETLRYTLQSAGLLPFIAAVRWHDHPLFRIFNTWPMTQLGLLSYSLYLMHMTALWAVEYNTAWPGWVRNAVALAVILVLARLIYVGIERPCGRLRRKLSRYLEGAT
jgi:peptidoglycan/LPS O-acetylase OafA/YrhL